MYVIFKTVLLTINNFKLLYCRLREMLLDRYYGCYFENEYRRILLKYHSLCVPHFHVKTS